MRYSPTTKGFYPEAIEYPVLPDDLVDITPEYHAQLMDDQSAGARIEPDAGGVPQAVFPVLPTEAQQLAAKRAAAVIDRGPLCLALYSAGILAGPSALEAAKGNWPIEFAAFLDSISPAEQIGAQIAWADATVVRYSNPLLQSTALAYCSGDATAATALLDSLFGVT